MNKLTALAFLLCVLVLLVGFLANGSISALGQGEPAGPGGDVQDPGGVVGVLVDLSAKVADLAGKVEVIDGKVGELENKVATADDCCFLWSSKEAGVECSIQPGPGATPDIEHRIYANVTGGPSFDSRRLDCLVTVEIVNNGTCPARVSQFENAVNPGSVATLTEGGRRNVVSYYLKVFEFLQGDCVDDGGECDFTVRVLSVSPIPPAPSDTNGG